MMADLNDKNEIDTVLENKTEDHFIGGSLKNLKVMPSQTSQSIYPTKLNRFWNLRDFQIMISFQLVLFIFYILASIIGYNNYIPHYKEREIGEGGYWRRMEGDVDYFYNMQNIYVLFVLIYAIGILIFFWRKEGQKNAFLNGLSKSIISLFVGGTLGSNLFSYLDEKLYTQSFTFISKNEGEQYLDDLFNKLLLLLVISILFLPIYYFSLGNYIKNREVKLAEEMRLQEEKAKEFNKFFESSEVAREFAQKFVNTRISLIKQSIDTIDRQNINTHVRSILTQDIDKLNQLFELNELPVFPSKYLIEYCYKLSEPFRVDFKDALKDYLTASLLEGEPTPLSEDGKVSIDRSIICMGCNNTNPAGSEFCVECGINL